jgi:hypothetical protein
MKDKELIALNSYRMCKCGKVTQIGLMCTNPLDGSCDVEKWVPQTEENFKKAKEMQEYFSKDK